jgi:ATP-dependent DNA helicase RecG
MDVPVVDELTRPVTALRSVGARSAAKLERLGIRTVRQLLWHLPSRYEDFSQSVPIDAIEPGTVQSIQGHVIAIATRNIWPRRMSITTATVQDDSGAVRAVWFNQPYLEESMPEGTLLSLSGKATLDKRGLYLSNPSFERVGEEQPVSSLRHTGRLVPVYPETEGISSKFLRYLIQPLLERIAITDPLPESVRRQYGLMPLADAVRTVHYPASESEVPVAKARLAFDDLLMLQLKSLAERRLMNLSRSPAVPMDAAYMRELVQVLPFTLTRDQRVAALEILRDMERPFPMNRLLEGDVGSGKTAVAALAALHAAEAGWQTVILAPTEVLAQQHARTLAPLADGRAHLALVTGSAALVDGIPATKAAVKRQLASGNIRIAIGTHALLESDVRFAKLALVVIDEQHRFGIRQRAALVGGDGKRSGAIPHLLSMTATPIPRTLALTIFGDLDISVIREKPTGRRPIETRVVRGPGRAEVYDFIRGQVKSGRQVFVICPVIETQTGDVGGRGRQRRMNPLWAQAKAVRDEYERLSSNVFPDLRLAMLHGKLPAKQKEAVMRRFKDGWYDILVATSVVEVGVDIPNATIMVIEGADRFGLAQLHQFRGRVGRSEHQSYCFLLATDDSMTTRRLQAMVKSDDGFVLAEEDMRIRGPGEFFGIKQSGMPDLTMAALTDPVLIKNARLAARTLMKGDPHLAKSPLLRAQMEQVKALIHFE